MTYDRFTVETALRPGDRLASEAERLGVPAAAIMRDYIVVAAADDALTIAVGDMANNLVGTATHAAPELALELSLPEDYAFNGGLLGSRALQSELAHASATGVVLVAHANDRLSALYAHLGLQPAEKLDPAERFTGYLTHVQIGRDQTTVTSVGDVYAWLNGRLIAGEEKIIDTRKDVLINTLTGTLLDSAGVDTKGLKNVVTDFATEARMDAALSAQLLDALTQNMRAEAGHVTRQTAYRPVDDIVTPWQIRTLQNRPPEERHPWAYGAIDGTATPEQFVSVRTFPTDEIQTLVIATDGSRPKPGHDAVKDATDLEPVNPAFSEQSIVAVRASK